MSGAAPRSFAASVVAGGSAATASVATDGSIHLRIACRSSRSRKVARGKVLATYAANGETQAPTNKAVTLDVQATGTSRVLHLELGELDRSLCAGRRTRHHARSHTADSSEAPPATMRMFG